MPVSVLNTYTSNLSEPFKQSLSRLAFELREGTLTAQQLLEIAIENHKSSSDSLGSYITWDPEAAIRQAHAADAAFAAGIDSGPLQGIPISIKDLFGIRNYPTYAGTPRPLPIHWCREGPLVRELRRQHSVITGKTHTVEFAFGGLGANPHWTTPRNPWDASNHRVPGGSSSGAGVSLSVGSALLAFGSDTAGSVRIPASMTGNVGMKTSFGRWSLDGIVPLSPSLDSVGFLCRTVEDAIDVFEAIDGKIHSRRTETLWRDSDVVGIQIGISEALLWSDCSPGIADCVNSALVELQAKGASLRSLKLPDIERVFPIFRKGGLAAAELHCFLKNELPEWISLLDEKISQRMEDAATLTACEYLERRELFRLLGATIRERMRTIDVLISPTVAVTAPTMNEIEDLQRYRESNLLSLRNTSIVNCLGLCGLTIPVGLDAAGIPVGMQLIMPHGDDRKLLEIGRAFERALGTSRERLGEAPLLHH